MPGGRVESVNTSSGGVPKASVFEALITSLGVAGDHQNDPRHHGGPDRAVVLFSLERIRALQAECHPIGIGTTGENLTVAGIDWTSMTPGAVCRIGEVALAITKYASPCEKIRRSFLKGDFFRISQERHPGWSRVCARVLAGGIVRPGDAIEIVTRK